MRAARRWTGIFALALLAAGCAAPRTPAGLPEMPAAFQRLPYLQAVDTASVEVRWRAVASAGDSFRYRTVASEGWAASPVLRGDTFRAGGRPPRTDRRVRLEGLPPGEAVEYVVFADSVSSGPHRFRTAPRPGTAERIAVLAFGDSGWGSPEQVRLADLMGRRSWDLAIHVGDLAYEDGTERDFTLRHFQVYRELLSRVPLFPAPGNHDVRTAGGRPYDRAFGLLGRDHRRRYYTFRWGPVRFFALDTTGESPSDLRETSGGSKQLAWLEATLDSVRREPDVRWIVVYMHHPIFSSGMGLSGHGSDIELRRVLQPLFDRHGVDLVLAGHDHHYQRTYPLREETRVRPGCGPVYVVTGGGGARTVARDIDVVRWSAESSRSHHFLRLLASAERLEVEAVGMDGRTLDRFRVLDFAGEAGELRAKCRR